MRHPANSPARAAQARQDLLAARQVDGSVDEHAAAVALGISRRTWQRLSALYGLQRIKLGRATRWRVADVDALAARLAGGGTP